jgi:hypothetical protein
MDDIYVEPLMYFIQNLGELYPLFHPHYLAALLQSVHRQRDDEKIFLLPMINAVASLGALYMGAVGLSQRFYALAKQGVQTFTNYSVEGFIIRTIMVSASIYKSFPLIIYSGDYRCTSFSRR